MLRLVDLKIVAERLEAFRDHLHPQQAKWNAIEARLAISVGLQFEPRLLLLRIFAHGMKDHRRIANRLAGFVLQHDEVRRRGSLILFLIACNQAGGNEKQDNNCEQRAPQSHSEYFRQVGELPQRTPAAVRWRGRHN